jgi:hypothetical protein
MIYLPNSLNLAREASVSVTNMVPSDAIARVSEQVSGGGSLDLTGPYTGQADTVIEVEVVDLDAGGAPRVSQPVFTGVGNGTLTDIDPGTLVPQVITVTCVDLGTETRFAVGRFCGVRLVAVAPGDPGNDIRISVDDSGLVSVPAEYSATRAIPAQAVDLEGEAFDFGGPSLTADGQVPATAPRLRFGRDPVVYRAWRRWLGNRWGYNLSPAPVRAIPAGTPVYNVSGTYTVSVTDGTTVRTYAGVTSVYDALTAMQADPSGLVSPVDPVIVDRSPLGMATLDVWDRTAPFVVAEQRTGSAFVQRAEIGYEPSTAAPTESITITCIDDTRPGQERWRVEGTQSGLLPAAITGALYQHPVGSFQVPSQLAGPPSVNARISYTVSPLPRTPPAPEPCIHLARLQLGARARSRAITWTLRVRPSPECDCTEQPIEGGPSFECLGLEPEGGVSVNMHPVLQRRLERVAAWRSRMASRRGGAVDGDVLMRSVNDVAAYIAQQLRRIDAGTPLAQAWAASQQVQPNGIRRPTTPNGRLYRYDGLSPATTGATEPIWPTTIGATVVDGGVTWVCASRDVGTELDDLLERVEGEWAQFERATRAASAELWRASVTNADAVAPTTANGRLYVRVTASALSGASEPSWPTTDYATVVDNQVTWMALPRYWTPSTSVPRGTVRALGFGVVARAVTGGTTGATEPSWFPRVGDAAQRAIGREVTDGSVTWRLEAATIESFGAAVVPNVTQYIDSLSGLFGPAFAAAGLDPFAEASPQGSRCWRDPGSAQWWVPDDPTLLPAFTGHYYHSVRRFFSPTGEETIEDAQEFGFGIQACDAVPGDSFTLLIEAGQGQSGGQTYVLGDKITVDVIRSTPVAFGGGQTGDDLLTWTVVGSVDGGLPDHVIDRTAPAPYSGGGLAFNLSLGGVPYALGDRFRFEIEGGRWRWRRDGGAWSAPRQIGSDAALADGLSVAWVPGEAPSFLSGDSWTFRALAVNGPQQVRRPIAGRMRTSAACTLTLSPATPGPVTHLAISDHAIPSAATITLQASATSDFAVLTYNQPVTWRAAHIVHTLPAAVTAAHWRLIVSAACEIGHVWLGVPLVLEHANGRPASGVATAQYLLPTQGRRRMVGAEVQHVGLTAQSLDALLDGLSHATEIDQGRLAVVIGSIPSIVRVGADALDVSDLRGWQPSDAALGRYSVRLQLEAAA